MIPSGPINLAGWQGEQGLGVVLHDQEEGYQQPTYYFYEYEQEFINSKKFKACPPIYCKFISDWFWFNLFYLP